MDFLCSVAVMMDASGPKSFDASSSNTASSLLQYSDANIKNTMRNNNNMKNYSNIDRKIKIETTAKPKAKKRPSVNSGGSEGVRPKKRPSLKGKKKPIVSHSQQQSAQGIAQLAMMCLSESRPPSMDNVSKPTKERGGGQNTSRVSAQVPRLNLDILCTEALPEKSGSINVGSPFSPKHSTFETGPSVSSASSGGLVTSDVALKSSPPDSKTVADTKRVKQEGQSKALAKPRGGRKTEIADTSKLRKESTARGNYKCSICGLPKQGHVCVGIAPRVRSMSTQCDLFVTSSSVHAARHACNMIVNYDRIATVKQVAEVSKSPIITVSQPLQTVQ